MSSAFLHASWRMIGSSRREVDSSLDDGWALPSSISTRYSDGIRVGVDTDWLQLDDIDGTTTRRRSERVYLDKQRNSYDDDSMPLCPGAPATTRGLDDSMACGRSDGVMTRCPTTKKFPQHLEDLMIQWFEIIMVTKCRTATRKSRSGAMIEDKEQKISSLDSIVFSLTINQPLRLT